MQCFKAELHEKSGLDESQMKVLECGIRWAGLSKEKRKGRTARATVREDASREHRQVGGDEWNDRGADRQRNCKSRPRGDERRRADETSRKGKGKGDGGKGGHEDKGGGFDQRKTARDDGERGGMGPNGAKHGGWWLTPPGHEGEQQRNAGKGNEPDRQVGMVG